MISKEEARNLVLERILSNWNIENDEPYIFEDATIEKGFGWVFFYNSRNFVETNEFSYCLGGNAPIIVNKFDASLQITGTAREAEYYIAEYEKTLTNQK